MYPGVYACSSYKNNACVYQDIEVRKPNNCGSIIQSIKIPIYAFYPKILHIGRFLSIGYLMF